ncbi:MAG: DNA polymerase III subunit alpha, partial [Bacilli bacterium]|nr:DNA polymerase III subunit alpha [Bacilli bacterium]
GELPLSVPVHFDPTWGLVAQYEMNYLEAQGFLKMDLLGLRNLTYVDICLSSLTREERGDLTPRSIPYRDEKAIELIASGKVMGLFQLESSGMRRTIRELRPTSFEDIAALLALYRPGPMDNIPSYIRRKHGQEKWTYLTPEMEPILNSTYGIIVYQEQIMMILTAMAGFSYGQADSFRRAISKKDASKMEALKGDFIKGCLAKGKKWDVAEKVYSLIYKFADYGFNKSHAYSYAVLTCQMAYLKARFPLHFYASILDGTNVGEGKFSALASEIKQSGYRFLLPDVNYSFHTFKAEGKGIRFPLNSIKGINGKLCFDIINERLGEGEYSDVFDLAMRCKRYGLTATSLVKFIDAGALDSLNTNRESLRASAEAIIRYAEMFTGSDGNAILLELNFPKPELIDLKPDKMADLLAEKNSLGIMISGSLLFSKEEIIKQKGLINIETLLTKERGNIACIISKVRAVLTKKGKRMAFLTVYDDNSELSLVCFEETYNRDFPVLKEGAIVEIEASADRRKEGYIANAIKLI